MGYSHDGRWRVSGSMGIPIRLYKWCNRVDIIWLVVNTFIEFNEPSNYIHTELMLQPLHSHFFRLQVYQVAKLHGSANGCLAHHMPEVGEYTRCTVDGRKYSTQMHNTSFKFRHQVSLMR